MSEFTIISNDSDLRLTLSNVKGDYFTAQVISNRLSAQISVWAHSDSYGFADLFDWLAIQDKPWDGEQYWQSLEGEFKVGARCSSLGVIVFTVYFEQFGGDENWKIETEIRSEMGQMPELARTARIFFGKSPV